MLYSYKELLKMKEKEKLDWENISKEQLEFLYLNENLSNNIIAELYDVTSSKVKYKIDRWDIKHSSPKYIFDTFKNKNSELFNVLDNSSKGRIIQKEKIDKIAKALTHYIFRNGPIEDMHANNQLSQNDMKTLNKYMVNKLATVLTLAIDGDWFKLELLLNYLSLYGSDWDKAEVDMEDVELIYNNFINNLEKEN